MLDKAAQWQRARGRFSHDWLKNRFLLTVGSFLSSASGEGYPVEDTLPSLVEVMAQWRERRDTLECLIKEFETAMSPATLFDSAPLCRLNPATREWLQPLTQRLWWKGRKNEILTSDVLEACQRADAEYKLLDAELNRSKTEPDTQALEGIARKMYAEFHRLADAIHRLPTNVEVV